MTLNRTAELTVGGSIPVFGDPITGEGTTDKPYTLRAIQSGSMVSRSYVPADGGATRYTYVHCSFIPRMSSQRSDTWIAFANGMIYVEDTSKEVTSFRDQWSFVGSNITEAFAFDESGVAHHVELYGSDGTNQLMIDTEHSPEAPAGLYLINAQFTVTNPRLLSE